MSQPPPATLPPTAASPPPDAATYLYGGLNDKYAYGGDDGLFFPDDDDDDSSGVSAVAIVAVAIALIGLILLYLKRDDLVRYWHRRTAARAAHMLGKDEEMQPVSSWLAGTTKPVKVIIELDGQSHTIGAPRDHFTSVTQLPFALTDACVDSYAPELSGLSIVDLCIAKKCELRYEARDGTVRPVSGTTTEKELQECKSVRVRVLG